MGQASAFALANCLGASWGLPPCNISQNLQVLFVHVFGDNGSNRLADHFLGAVAIQILRTLVPGHDDACEITADDGFVGGGHDGSQLVAAFLDLGADFVGADHWLPIARPRRALSVSIRYAA